MKCLIKERKVGMNKQQNSTKNYQKDLKKNKLVLKKKKNRPKKNSINK